MSDELHTLDLQLIAAVDSFSDLEQALSPQAQHHWLKPRPTLLCWAQSRMSRAGSWAPQSDDDDAAAAFHRWRQSIASNDTPWLCATRETLRVVEQLVAVLREQAFRPSTFSDTLLLSARRAVEVFGQAFPTSPEPLPGFVAREVTDPVDAALELIREQISHSTGRHALTVGGWLMFRRLVLWLLTDWQSEVRTQRPAPHFTTTANVLIAVTGNGPTRGRVGALDVVAEDCGLAGAYLDPVGLALTQLEDRVLVSVRRAWEYGVSLVFAKNPSAVLLSVCLAPQWTESLRSLDGGSAGGLFAASVVAGLTQRRLNRRATATIVISDQHVATKGAERLPPVPLMRAVADGTLKEKLIAARERQLMHVVVETQQALRFQDEAQRLGITLYPASSLDVVVNYLAHDFAQLNKDRRRRITVPLPDPHFRGRQQELQATHEALLNEQSFGLSQAAHWGQGGVGKTSLARAYAWEYWSEWPDGIFFLHGQLDHEKELLTLTKPLGISTELDEADRLADILDWLKSHENWLIILDNVDSKDDWKRWQQYFESLPRRVLVTTRLERLPGVKSLLPVGRLSEDEALQLLAARRLDALSAEHVEAAKELIDWLHGYALGLSLAAAYLSLKPSLTWREYLDDLRRRPHFIMDRVDDTALDELGTLYDHRMLDVFADFFAALHPVEQRLLQYAAVLPADGFVTEWLSDLIVSDPATPWPEPDPGESEQEWEPRLRHLFDLGALNGNSERRLCSMHRILLHRLRADLAERQGASRRSPSNLAETPTNNAAAASSGPLKTALITHIATRAPRWARSVRRCLCDRFDHTQDADLAPLIEVIELLREHDHWHAGAVTANWLSQPFEQLVRHRDRERVLRPFTAEAIAEQVGDEYAIALNNLAQLLQATNRLAEAEPLMVRVVTIVEKSLGENHPNVATALNNLAQLLQDTNRLSEAEPLMRRALAIDESSYGAEHPKVARHLNNLALLLEATNRLAEAEPLMRRALAIDESSYGPEHPKVAIRLNNLAALLKATNRLAEAEPLMARVVTIFEKSLGENHPNVAVALNNLAALLQDTNRLAEAEPLMRRALAIDESSYGAEHPNVASALNNLAHLLQATNRLAEAEPLMRRALAIFVRFGELTGHQDPHTETVQENYQLLLAEIAGTA